MFIPLIDSWAIASQQVSRRNAMIASTALTQRRSELIEVEEFFAAIGEGSTQEIAARAANG